MSRTSSGLLRVGVLGAARILRDALITPARRLGVDVVGISARDPKRAARSARVHGITTVYAAYEDLLADSGIDAVYVPLPAALHGRWTLAALRAGKHVLVEKPFCANAEEAALIAEAAVQSDRVIMEAHHTTYHPMVDRLAEIVATGMLGANLRVDAAFCVPIRPGHDIRWSEQLGGGSLMDLGCYPLRMARDVFGSTPRVLSAAALIRAGVDRAMSASLRFPDGTTMRVTSSMWSRHVFRMAFSISGDQGRVHVTRPYHPQTGAKIHLRVGRERFTESVTNRSSYELQLKAFVDATHGADSNRTGPAESLETMRLIDDIYRAAGMRPRQPLP